MRYQNLKSFQKHLASAAPHHLCRFYLVAIADDFERRKTLNEVLSYFKIEPTRISCDKSALADCMNAMQSMSLFGESMAVIDCVEKLSKKEVQTLADSLSAASGFVLIGSRSKLGPLFALVEKEGVVLDLLDEKPWDKEKRLAEILIERAHLASKKLLPDAAHLLFERLSLDQALLESEIDKLICYVGERPTITKEDILSISAMSQSSTLWSQAEEIVWEGADILSMDSTSFHGLIPALRSQLHIGLSLATLIEEKKPSTEWGRYLPKLWPKTLEKRSSQAARLGVSYFRKKLEKLFEIELLSRSNSTQYSALLTSFQAETHAR
jgi:DNA polymerase-3 subunit delta